MMGCSCHNLAVPIIFFSLQMFQFLCADEKVWVTHVRLTLEIQTSQVISWLTWYLKESFYQYQYFNKSFTQFAQVEKWAKELLNQTKLCNCDALNTKNQSIFKHLNLSHSSLQKHYLLILLGQVMWNMRKLETKFFKGKASHVTKRVNALTSKQTKSLEIWKSQFEFLEFFSLSFHLNLQNQVTNSFFPKFSRPRELTHKNDKIFSLFFKAKLHDLLLMYSS